MNAFLFFSFFIASGFLTVHSNAAKCPEAFVLKNAHENLTLPVDKNSRGSSQDFNVIMFPGLQRNPAWMLSTVILKFACGTTKNQGGGNYEVFIGSSNDSVCDQHSRTQSLVFGLMSHEAWAPKHISVQPFRRAFVGLNVKKDTSCNVSFSVQKISMFYLWLLVLSLFTFIKASSLSKSAWMHLSTGTVVGVLCSLLLLAYVISRFMPRKSISALFFIGGWTMTAYVAQFLYQNFIELSETYKLCLAGYCVTVGALSCAYCYYKGPIENVRTHNIIAAFIRLLAAFGVFNSVQLEEVSCVLIVLMLTYKYLPGTPFGAAFNWVTLKWRRHNPPKKVFLSVEDYRIQGEVETQKALEELREFCRSPQSNPWNIVKRLNRPERVASFVEGDGHLSQLELSLYDEEMSRLSFDSSDQDDEELANQRDASLSIGAYGDVNMTSSSSAGATGEEISPQRAPGAGGTVVNRKGTSDRHATEGSSEDSGNTEN